MNLLPGHFNPSAETQTNHQACESNCWDKKPINQACESISWDNKYVNYACESVS
jgi:hypothetical protein